MSVMGYGLGSVRAAYTDRILGTILKIPARNPQERCSQGLVVELCTLLLRSRRLLAPYLSFELVRNFEKDNYRPLIAEIFRGADHRREGLWRVNAANNAMEHDADIAKVQV
jgi:hypothetical protein